MTPATRHEIQRNRRRHLASARSNVRRTVIGISLALLAVLGAVIVSAGIEPASAQGGGSSTTSDSPSAPSATSSSTGGASSTFASSTSTIASDVSVAVGLTVACQDGEFVVLDTAHVECNSLVPPGSTTTSSSTSTSTSTTTSTSTSTTTSTSLPPTTGCSGGTTVTGDQQSAWNEPVSGPINASSAVWNQSKVGDYAVSVFGSTSGVTWCGGRIIGDSPDPLHPVHPWTGEHYMAGFRFSQPSMTVTHVESSYYGDAFKPKDAGGSKATNWTLRHVYVKHAYDDCIENDYLHGGLVQDSLLNCYVGYSARSSGQGTSPDGDVTFDHVLLRLDPQTNVYKGTVPGTGGFFKLSSESPHMVLRNSTFRADQLPNHQDLNPPSGVTCSGNTILWGGSGTFPAKAAWVSACPDTTIVEGAAAVSAWNAKVSAW